MTGTLLLDPAERAAAHARALRPRRRHELAVRRPAPLRHRRARARPGGARRVLRRPARRRAARAATFTGAHLHALAQALPRADQGVPARPEADRRASGNIYADEALFRARIHPLRPRRPAHARAVRRRCATRSSRRCRPGSRPRARRSTTSATPTASAAPSRTSSSSTCARASRARAAARAVRKLRAARARDLRLRALPAAPRARRYAAAASSREGARRGRPARAPGSRRAARRR